MIRTTFRPNPLRWFAACTLIALCCTAMPAVAVQEPILSAREHLLVLGQKPEPPPMPHRAISKPAEEPAGERIEIVDGDYKPLLFIPAGFVPPEDGRVRIVVHFHGGIWFPIDEHLRRGMTEPLLVCHFGEGSSVYARPFASDPDRFGRFVAAVEQELRKRPGAEKTAVVQVDLTSFSAGYGAVREIIKRDDYIALIRRIILCDSLYAGWDPATTQPGTTSRPALENMRPFEKFIALAAEGKKTFVLAHSHVPTPYANTAATARWLAEFAGAPRVEIEPGSTPASSVADFPLLYRADLGHLHIWGYAGVDAQAHLTSVRHLAEIWQALDACGDGR